MMLMVAPGDMRAMVSTSSGSSSRPSTLTTSLAPMAPLGTFMSRLTTVLEWLPMPKIFSTLSACPDSMWSMTVPLLIGFTLSSRSLTFISDLLAHHQGQHGHPDGHSVEGLLEVPGVPGGVDSRVDLVHP